MRGCASSACAATARTWHFDQNYSGCCIEPGLKCPPPSDPLPSAALQFEDQHGNVIYERHANPGGDFHFIAAEEGEYKLCFTVSGGKTCWKGMRHALYMCCRAGGMVL